jgi:hypothetical protein
MKGALASALKVELTDEDRQHLADYQATLPGDEPAQGEGTPMEAAVSR